LREFVLRQDQVFLRRSCGGGTLPAHGFAPGVPEYTHASATLNDTELRKIFRRENTPQKSFLGHARVLNDLPIEAATTRPTQRFAAHDEKYVRPQSAARFVGRISVAKSATRPAAVYDPVFNEQSVENSLSRLYRRSAAA
jgi:hypothetical protein